MNVSSTQGTLITPDVAAELRHELRTPVNHILGYAELLREDVADGSVDAKAFDDICAAARSALTMINAALPPTGVVRREALTQLLVNLAEPQAKVIAATRNLLAEGRDEQFATDVKRIAQAANRLTTVPTAPSANARPLEAVANQDRPASPPPPSAVAPSAVGSTNKILIVDDVDENRTVLARRLVREGYAVDSVASGEEALARIANGSFDLVLLDVLMPGMDGFAVLERIKSSDVTRSIPVIMISALDDLASVVRCIEHGAEDYLAKPFDQVLLRARIGASLEKKRWHDREADYLRQVAKVIEAAGAVEHGTYAPGALGSIVGRDDELGRLARVFDAMAVGVRQREARLREQLLELRSDVTKATNEFKSAQPEPAGSNAGSDDAFAIGRVLGTRYEILDVIGRGGMGVVYRAHDRELGEEVAIKTIRRELLTFDPVLAEQLKSEIRLARRISHRNVVRTHDLGDADGIAFVTMEYVRGITVRELLETRGKLGAASALALARQFAEALAVAHAAGVIHRDVKPENALIDSEGVLKVMDFGIARFTEATSSRTQTGMAVGTPTYMAPEQLAGDPIDPRADLYALGVVLYECLTGHPPFKAPSLVSLIAKVLTTTPPLPSEGNPDVPPALSALVMRLLSKNAEDRPAHATELIELLAELS